MVIRSTNPLIRNYRWRDYKQCEHLVEKVWRFNTIFPNPALRRIASLGYTKGSLEGSNISQVVEHNGKVVGFLFGKNDRKKLFKYYLLFKVSMLWRLFWFPGDKSERNDLLTALKTHVTNRSAIVEKGRSEILLFVVDPEYQGCGLGQLLWLNFRDQCMSSGVDAIYVSTNTSEATGFYGRMGFVRKGDFSSPLHEIAQWPGRPCMYEFKC